MPVAAGFIVATAIGLQAGTIAFAVVSTIVSLAASQIFDGVFGKKPSKPDAPGQTVTVRAALAGKEVSYGLERRGGTYVYLESSGTRNRDLHMGFAVADHLVRRTTGLYFDDIEVELEDHPSEAGTKRPIASNRFHGNGEHVKYREHLGAWDQAADSVLVARVPNWTNDHRGRGTFWNALDLRHDPAVFPGGAPNPAIEYEARLVYDPRDGGQDPADPDTWEWTDNAALAILDYARGAPFRDDSGTVVRFYGLNADDADIDLVGWVAEANICDEAVPIKNRSRRFTADDTTDVLTFPHAKLQDLRTGTGVTLTTDDTLPAPLATATTYYWIRDSDTRGRLATSLANARALVAIDITDSGTGSNHRVVTETQPRYTLNGTVEIGDVDPKDILGEMLVSCDGTLIHQGGLWRFFAGAARAKSVSLGPDELRGSHQIVGRRSIRGLFNAVKGTFRGPDSRFIEVDFPALKSATFKAEDNGEELFDDIDLRLVNTAAQAQRLAKIHLLKERQQITVTAPFNLKAFRTLTGAPIGYTAPTPGWVDKHFRVRGWALAAEDDGGSPRLGVDLDLRETDASIWDWTTDEEQDADPAPDTSLPSAWVTEQPGAPQPSESLFVTRDGAGVRARVDLSWIESDDGFVDHYEPQWRIGGGLWRDLAATPFLTAEVLDLKPGIHDFRVRARNHLGVPSAWSTTSGFEVFALAAAPVDVTGLTLQVVGGLALLNWDRHPDLDVRVGGRLEFRHSNAQSGATWQESVAIGRAVEGTITQTVLPLRPGTYLVRAFDSGGRRSPAAATAATSGATVLAFANLESVSEHPNFAGTHDDTFVDISALQLVGAGLFDDIADLDAISSLDSTGGVVSSGTYDFAAGVDRGSITRVRLRPEVAVIIVNVNDLIDDRTDPIDEWDDFDGADSADADLQIWTRETDDDPGGSPTWSPWRRLDSSEYQARAYEFQARLASADPAYNIRVTTLTVHVENVV